MVGFTSDRLTAARRERRTRLERQARTRAALLRAGERTYLKHGFRGASAVEIARRAGFSTGALYSNFTGKEDLLLTVLDQRATADAGRLTTAVQTAGSVDEVVNRVVDWFATLLDDDPRWRTLEVELSIAALTKPKLAERLRRRHRAFAGELAELLRRQSARFGADLTLDSDTLSAALLGLGDGLSVHRVLDPELDAVGVFRRVLIRLLGATGG